MPDRDAVRSADLAFHLGDREQFELRDIGAAASSVPAPDEAFVCFRREPPQFFSGDIYKTHCRIGAERIEFDLADIPPGKNRRTVVMINRDFAALGKNIPYAYSLRDGRKYDYAAIFGTQRPIPVFQYYRRRGLPAIVHPLPGFNTFPSPMIPDAADTLNFGGKRAKIFWRGRLSGRVEWQQGYTGSSKVLADPTLSEAEKIGILGQVPRFTFCRDFLGHDAVDAGLTFKEGSENIARGAPFLERLAKPRAGIAEHLQYRYLLALDGNDNPSSLYWMLNTNSVVLRQESSWEAFGESYFVPWLHYVPIRADGSDLLEKFDWCERNTPKCERISANARSAWSILFNPRYQVERRKAVMTGYRAWFTGATAST